MNYRANFFYKIFNFTLWLIGIFSLSMFLKNKLSENIFGLVYIILFALYFYLHLMHKEHYSKVIKSLYVEREIYEQLYEKYKIYKEYQGKLDFDSKIEFQKKIENRNMFEEDMFKNEYYNKYLK